MELMERYIYAVQKYLPESLKEEVGKELRANIYDMLSDEPDERELLKVLEELGSPKRLAEEYNTKKRYLIGPGYYEKYLEVLKLVAVIVAVVMVGISAISFLFGTSMEQVSISSMVEFFAKSISSVLSGTLQAAFWVTFAFVIIERSGAEEGYRELTKKEWSIKDLPQVPSSKDLKISKVETLITLLVTIFIMILLYRGAEVTGIFWLSTEGGITNVPLLDADRIGIYIPVLWIFALAQLGLVIWQFAREYWNLPMALYNLFFEVAFCVLIIIMLLDPQLLDGALAENLARTFGGASEGFLRWIERGKLITGAFIIFFSLLDGLSTLYKVRRNMKKAV